MPSEVDPLASLGKFFCARVPLLGMRRKWGAGSCARYNFMKIIVATLIAFLLGSALISNRAEAGCWWNGYNHCGYYHHAVYHGGDHHYGSRHGYNHHVHYWHR